MAESDFSSKYTHYSATKLDESSQKEVEEAIGESEESKALCLQILRNALQEIQDIEPCLDETFLLKFLRVSKFDGTKACDRIKRYHQMQKKMSKILRDVSIPNSVIQSMPYNFVLPYRAKNNSLINLARIGLFDYSKISFHERSYLDWIAIEFVLENPLTQICGVTTIFDFAGFTYKSLLAASPRTMVEYMDFAQNAIPLRIKGFHIVNAPSIFRIIYNVVYLILSEKLRSRFFVHPNNDNWKSLHQHISPEILPEEYGGVLKSSSIINLLENVVELEDHFCKQLKFGYTGANQFTEPMKFITPG